MKFIERLKDYERSFPWTISGFVLAALLGLLSIYLGFFQKVSPDLNFITTSNSSVLDIKENLGDLDVVYEGQSLKDVGKDLRIITFEVVNQGNDAILSNYYDSKYPVGFEVKGGVIADEPSVISSSNNYLSENIRITRNGAGEAFFSNVILEPGEFYEIKVLVLHDVGDDPYIEPLGKVANVSKLEVFNNYSESDKRSFFEIAFGGGWEASLARLVFYGFLFLMVIVFIGFSVELFNSRRRKSKKKKLIKTFKCYNSDEVTSQDDVFFERYLKSSYNSRLKATYDFLSNEDYLKFVFLVVKDKKLEGFSDKKIEEAGLVQGMVSLDDLLRNNIIKVSDGVPSVDKKRLELLGKLIDFLKKHDFRVSNEVLHDHGFSLDSYFLD